MASGGFDVIIGNPPYVEYSQVKKEYEISGYNTLSAGNLYAYFIERSFNFLKESGRFGMIVQMSMCCTQRMKPVFIRFVEAYYKIQVRDGKHLEELIGIKEDQYNEDFLKDIKTLCE